MEVKTQSKLIFQGVTFPNVHYDAFSRYDGNKSISVNVVPKVFYPEDDKLFFRIVMEVNLTCDGSFNLFLNAIGDFSFDKELKEEDLKKTFVNVNAPAIMFPYVRSFVSTFTGNLGGIIGCLTIPTKFFSGELEEYLKEEMEK